MAKCVAMNPKKGMKGRPNEKRAKARHENGGASKSQKEGEGGSERRISARTVSGSFRYVHVH